VLLVRGCCSQARVLVRTLYARAVSGAAGALGDFMRCLLPYPLYSRGVRALPQEPLLLFECAYDALPFTRSARDHARVLGSVRARLRRQLEGAALLQARRAPARMDACREVCLALARTTGDTPGRGRVYGAFYAAGRPAAKSCRPRSGGRPLHAHAALLRRRGMEPGRGAGGRQALTATACGALRQAAVERLEAQARGAGLGPAAPARSSGGRYVPLLARATEPALEERLLKAGRRRPGPPAEAAAQPQGGCDARHSEPANSVPCTAACPAEVRSGAAGERALCLHS
jgi:hypothetical protein